MRLTALAHRRRSGLFVLASVLLIHLLAAANLPEPAAGGLTLSDSSMLTSPNVILILTDDQDLLLGSLDAMPLLQSLLVDQGTSFANFIVPTTFCCPARASLLRGQYAHNTGIFENVPPDGGFEKFHASGVEDETLATALQRAGYRTALVGKYLNGYPNTVDPTYIPPGWDEWIVPTTDSAYSSYWYWMNENGNLVFYGSQPEDYITDVLAQHAVDFITRTAILSPSLPFFMELSFYAPHSPYNPAPRHAGLFSGAQAPRTPSFNESDMSDKPRHMQNWASLTLTDTQVIDSYYALRLESLQAVDEAIQQLVSTLLATGQLDNTYLIFTSDNGYHMGQHRSLRGKGMAWEEDLMVPLVVRGPGVEAGVVRNELGLIVDLAPTIADIAGAGLTYDSDGRSLLPLLHDPAPPVGWRQAALTEHYRYSAQELPTPNDMEPRALSEDQLHQEGPILLDYVGLRTATYKYIQRVGYEQELYDLVGDPYELYNLADDAQPALLSALSNWTATYGSCAGSSCQTAEEMDPPPIGLMVQRTDLNRDGQIDVQDLVMVASCWQAPVSDPCGDRRDVDHDGDIDIVDVARVVASWSP